MHCMVVGCINTSSTDPSLSFHRIPRDEKLLKRWEKFCGQSVGKSSRVCSDHFLPEDFENTLKYELGFTKSLKLKPGTVPTIYQKDAEYTETVEKNQRQEYKKIVDVLLHQYEEDANLTMEFSSDVAKSTSNALEEINTQEAVLINEALFDHEEISRHQSVFIADTDNAVPPFPNSIDIKTEDYAVTPFFNSKGFQSNAAVVTPFLTSKSSQTAEAAKDRINCGFVNVSKSGPEQHFNLRCFYCDAEYPISVWSEFTDHIKGNHSHLEKDYDKEDNLASTTNEHNVIDLIDSSNEPQDEELPPINFINIDNIESTKDIRHGSKLEKIVAEDSNTLDAAEQFLYVEKYEPNNEHNYSQRCPNKSLTEELMDDDYAIDEICFGKTPYNVIMDFLDHLKGLQHLWHERSVDCEKYDRELLSFKNIMKLKWELNLRMDYLHKSLEDIKTWFYAIRAAKEKSADSNIQHIFHEYYEKCAEFLPFAKDSKNVFICDFCKRSYARLIQLQAHKYRRHKIGELPYSCSKCYKRFAYIDHLIKHVKKHLTMPPKRREEKEIVTIEEKEIVTIEEKENVTKEENEIVTKPHPSKGKMEKDTANEPPLKQNKEAKIVEEPQPSPSEQEFKCFECNQNFSCPTEYKLHLDIHPKGNCPFVCEECGKRYKNINGLKGHKIKHKSTGYECEFCSLKLASTSSFNAHMAAHKGIYEYVCEWCGKQCVNRKYWKEHIQFEHLGYGICKICNRDYKKRPVLMKHLRNLHRPIFGTVEELALSSNNGKYWRKRGANLKLRKYEYVIDPVTQKRRIKCPKCDENFRCPKILRRHALSIHNYDIPDMKREKPQKSVKPKLYKYYWKRPIRIVDDSGAINSNVQEAAFAAITECSATKVESPHNSSDLGSDVCIPTDMNAPTPILDDTVNEVNEIQDDTNETGISFEQLACEIADEQSSDKIDPPLVAKVEDFETSAIEFILNTDGMVFEVSEYLSNA